jgi:hypothetical protein
MPEAHFGHRFDFSLEEIADEFDSLSGIQESESVDFDEGEPRDSNLELNLSMIKKVLAL